MKVTTLIKSDAYRYTGQDNLSSIINLYVRSSGFRFTFWFRIASRLRKNKLFYLVPWLILTRLKFKYGYDIPAETKISEGFYIGHFGGIVISSKAVIKKNFNISQGVTIGYNPRGKNIGYPVIGENVYIGPGAIIFGNINIGDNVAIGANSVVNTDIPSNCTFGGIPARKISDWGSEEIIKNKIN
jgi:serine O-acetyltransferase